MITTAQDFLRKESSKDALRNILVILIPAIFLFYWIGLDTAIACAVGTVLSSLTDLPGNRQDKTATAIWTIPLFVLAAWSTATAMDHIPWATLPILGIFGFLCTLCIALGTRWGVIGNLTLIVISFTVGLKPQNPLLFSASFTLGTLLFFFVSLVQVYLWPYRSLKYAMKEGFEQMATLLQAKIKCYDEHIPLEQVYKELSLLHIKISEQLETIRSLLLREKRLIATDHGSDLIWLNKIYRLIDLYELLMGVDSDYETIREKLGSSEVLPIIRHILLLLSEEIKNLENTQSMHSDEDVKDSRHLDLVERSMNYIEQLLNRPDNGNKALISSILTHIKHITGTIQHIQKPIVVPDPTWVSATAYQNFVPSINKRQVFRKHILSRSPILIYSVRMATLLILSGLVGYTLPEYRYASWIILTVILVARPSYANTQKRNYQRIVGSLIGLALSLLITVSIDHPVVLLGIAALSLYGFFLFNKPNYLICVIFITLSIILSLHLYDGDIWALLSSRLVFTLLGSAFAVLGCLALPIDHGKTMKSLSEILIDNYYNYYHKLCTRLHENTIDHQELRLVRKHAQTSLAQLYDSLDQFQKEPHYKKQDWNDLITFQTLAYRINALLVGLSISITKSIAYENDTALRERLDNIEILIHDLNILGQSEKLAHKNPAAVS